MPLPKENQLDEDIAKDGGPGASNDKIWSMGACEGAFSCTASMDKTEIHDPDLLINSKQGTELIFLGILMETTDPEKVKIMNCPCVLDKFKDIGVWYGNNSYEKTHLCKNDDCSSVCCHTCKKSDPRGEKRWKCPLDCYKNPPKNIPQQKTVKNNQNDNGKRSKRKAIQISDPKQKKRTEHKDPEEICSQCGDTNEKFMNKNPNSLGIKWRFHAETKQRYPPRNIFFRTDKYLGFVTNVAAWN